MGDFRNKQTFQKQGCNWTPYIDDRAGLAVLDAHVLGSSTDDTEGSSIVNLEHHLELLVSGLVKHGVKRVTGIVDNDVDLAESPTFRIGRRD